MLRRFLRLRAAGDFLSMVPIQVVSLKLWLTDFTWLIRTEC